MKSITVRVRKRTWLVSRFRYVFFRFINPMKAKMEKQIDDILLEKGELNLQDLWDATPRFIDCELNISIDAGVKVVPSMKSIPCPICAFYLGKKGVIS